MALNIGISHAKDKKGNIVVYAQSATFSKDELKKIRVRSKYELWSSRGREPIAVIYALNDKVAREYLKDKYHMKGLHIEKVAVPRRKLVKSKGPRITPKRPKLPH